LQVKTGGVAARPKKRYFLAMKNIKNYIIALLLAVIALMLFNQPAQSAPKSPSAVQLINYEACVHSEFDMSTQFIIQYGNGSGVVKPADYFKRCKMWLTQSP
jgi:hypothetical protein